MTATRLRVLLDGEPLLVPADRLGLLGQRRAQPGERSRLAPAARPAARGTGRTPCPERYAAAMRARRPAVHPARTARRRSRGNARRARRGGRATRSSSPACTTARPTEMRARARRRRPDGRARRTCRSSASRTSRTPCSRRPRRSASRRSIVPWVPDARKRCRGRRARRRGSSRPARRSRDAGLRFGYHNHASSSANGRPLEPHRRAPGLDLELDVGWLRVAGHDPVAGSASTPAGCRSCTPRTCAATATAGTTSSPATASSTSPAIAAAARARRARATSWSSSTTRPTTRSTTSRRSLATLRDALAVTRPRRRAGRLRQRSAAIYLDNAPRLDGAALRRLHRRRPGARAERVAREHGLDALQHGGAAARDPTSRSCSA